MHQIHLEDGSNYTGRMFNEDIKKLLSKHVDYQMGKYLAHLFRAGFATLMAELGNSDNDICAIGKSPLLCIPKCII